MAPHTTTLALLYILALASATDAAPIRRHDMTKRSAALKVVKRDSEEALSPLARFLKGFSAAQTASESTQQGQGAVVAKLGQDVNDTVRLVMANPMGSSSASSASPTASSVSAMVDQGAMQSAYAQAIDGLDASASSAAAPVASSSAMADTDSMQEAYNQAIQGLSQETDEDDDQDDASHSAMVDQDAMVDAYQQAVDGLSENASDSASSATQKAKRSYYAQVENRLQTPGAVSGSVSGVPTPTASEIIVNVDGSLMPLSAFPTITERLVPTAVVEEEWVPSGSSSVEVDYTRLAYQVQDAPASAIAMEEAHSAPVSHRPAPSGASAAVASHSAVLSAESSEADEEDVPLPNQKAQYLPLKHGF